MKLNMEFMDMREYRRFCDMLKEFIVRVKEAGEEISREYDR